MASGDPRKWLVVAATSGLLAATGVIVASSSATASPNASVGKPRLIERQIIQIAIAAAKNAGDPEPTLIQHSEGTRQRANLIAVTSKGSPDHALTSILEVLRRAATPADRFSVRAPVLPGEGPGGPIGSPPPTGEDVYINASRRARTALGATFYIVPAGQETGLRPTPARCDAEQAAVLEHALKQDPKTLRDRIGELQQQYLTWERYEALNPEGILLMTVNAKAVGNDGGASTAQIQQQGLLDGNAGYPVRALMSGVVPDGVASVTLRYGRGSLTAHVVNNVFVALPQARGSLGCRSPVVIHLLRQSQQPPESNALPPTCRGLSP